MKMYWSHRGRDGFTGVNRAGTQSKEEGAPSLFFRPLLKNQRAQGLLGAHLGPLRKLNLVDVSSLSLTDEGTSLIAGAGGAPELREGDWGSWTRAFGRAGAAFDGQFRARLRNLLRRAMPDLSRALASISWRKRIAWKEASRRLGESLRPYALLAHEFCPWADRLRTLFHELIHARPGASSKFLPPRLSARVPPALRRWDPLRGALSRWRRDAPGRVLAELHEVVFRERGYERDLWLRWEDGKPLSYPGRASLGVAPKGSDCRWGNAVELMGPGR